jgi:hypothetical protein
MTQNPDALVLGGGQVFANRRMVGQVKGASVERRVTKASHDTNYGLEYSTDHVISIKTAFNVRWTFEEISPQNANMLVGMPGYGAVPVDRSLPGSRRTPALLAYGTTRRQDIRYPRLLLDAASNGIWSPLLYPIAMQDSAAVASPEISIDNSSFTGTAVGYKAYVMTFSGAAKAHESLPSNIEFVPYTKWTSPSDPTDDQLRLTFFLPTVQPAPLNFNLYQAPVTRLANGEFQFTGPFVNVKYFTGLNPAVGFAPNADGSYTVVNNGGVGSLLKLLLISSLLEAVEPPCPVTVTVPIAGSGVASPASWPEDFQYDMVNKGSGAVRISPASAILLNGAVATVTYWYDISTIRELPLIGSGTNPVIEVDLQILFPDQVSMMIWHFYKFQVNSDMSIATSDTDWMNQDFTGETLDASSQYPRYGFGYMQLVGPITATIREFGNQPYDGLINALGANQTNYA